MKALDRKVKFMWNVTLAIYQMNIEINNKTTDVLPSRQKSNYNDNIKLVIFFYCHVQCVHKLLIICHFVLRMQSLESTLLSFIIL